MVAAHTEVHVLDGEMCTSTQSQSHPSSYSDTIHTRPPPSDCQLPQRPRLHHVLLLWNLDPSDDLLSMDPSPLAQIVNLRGQAEKASRTQSLYTAKRVGGWCEWSDVQKARQHALKKLNEQSGKSLVDQRTALRDAAAISLLSLIPPDRVGCISKLRLGSRPGSTRQSASPAAPQPANH